MGNAPEFSIVMATYNRARLLPRAIESVRAQTQSDWELIVVDDGSTDDTVAVMAAWKDDARIRYVRLTENQGASVARNHGIETARGAFVMVWDSDDELYPDALAALSHAFRARPEVGIVSAPAVAIREGKKISYDTLQEGYITLAQILCKYLGNYEKVRAARRELFAQARYRSRNLDFMVNGYLARQAPWYHLASPLGVLHLDGTDSLTRARRTPRAVWSMSRAPHLSAYLELFGTELKSGCPNRYAAYAYGAALGSLLAGNTAGARHWSQEAVHGGLSLRAMGLYVLARAPGGRTILESFFTTSLPDTSNDDVLVVARARGFWETAVCCNTFPHIRLLPSYASRWRYPGHFLRLLLAIAWQRPHTLILGTTTPMARWMARLRRAGLMRGLRLLTDHQFLTSEDLAQFDAVWTYSRAEHAQYAPEVQDHLAFLHYPSKVALVDTGHSSGDYVFAGGNHKRDHASFLTAMAGLPLRGILITGNPITVPVPENVEVRTPVPMHEYFSVMAGARFVVLALAEHTIPHGHGDASAALSIGKAVITTRGAGVDDYVEDGVNGLLVSPGDILGYRAAIQTLWADEALRARLEAGAREKARVLTYEHFARELSALCHA